MDSERESVKILVQYMDGEKIVRRFSFINYFINKFTIKWM